MAIDTTYNAPSAFDVDQETMRQRREFEIAQLEDRRRHKAGIAAKSEGKDSILAQAEQLEKLVQQAKKIKLIITGVAALEALTVIGIILTIVQLNIQLAFSVFKLPGEKWFGLPAPLVMVPVVLALDLLIFIFGVIIGVTLYALMDPFGFACKIPLSGSSLWMDMLNVFKKISCAAANVVTNILPAVQAPRGL